MIRPAHPPHQRRSKLLVALLLAWSAPPGLSLSLGPLQGAAVIGASLDLRVPVQVEAGSDGSAYCFSAEVFHADTRVEASRIRVSFTPNPEPMVRVQSAAPVDEPVVRVVLRADCGDRSARSYTLLADLPGSAERFAVPGWRPSFSLGDALPGRRAAVAAGTRAPVERTAADVAGTSISPATGRADTRKSRRTDERPPTAASLSRLKLDLADLPSEVAPLLRQTLALAQLPSADPARRAQALALWQAISAQTQDILDAAQQIKTLQAQMQALRQTQGHGQQELVDLQGQLAQARADQYENPLVIGLAALLAAAATLVIFLLWRLRRSATATPTWWQRPQEPQTSAKIDPVAAATGPAVPPPDIDNSPKFEPVIAAHAVATAVAEKSSAPAAAPAAAPVPSPTVEVPWPISVNVEDRRKANNAEELFDLEQQADFFESVGQHDQAIEVLRRHIQGNPAASPKVYLHLLGIYHAYSRKEDYTALREVFCRLFNARLPDFAGHANQGQDLQAYPRVLDQIRSRWFSPDVLEVLETAMYRDGSADDPREPFDLAAFRDLMLLHGIALDVGQTGAAPMPAAPTPATGTGAAPAVPSDVAPTIQHDNLIEFDLQALRPKPAGPSR